MSYCKLFQVIITSELRNMEFKITIDIPICNCMLTKIFEEFLHEVITDNCTYYILVVPVFVCHNNFISCQVFFCFVPAINYTLLFSNVGGLY